MGNKLVVADTFGINISIQALATTFHFIGQIHFGIPNENSNIGKYTFNYNDASTLDVILDSNSGSSNWSIDDHCCNWRQRDLPMASLAFQEATPIFPKESLLRELIFENPEPDKFIDSIDFVSSGTGVTPFWQRSPTRLFRNQAMQCCLWWRFFYWLSWEKPSEKKPPSHRSDRAVRDRFLEAGRKYYIKLNILVFDR